MITQTLYQVKQNKGTLVKFLHLAQTRTFFIVHINIQACVRIYKDAIRQLNQSYEEDGNLRFKIKVFYFGKIELTKHFLCDIISTLLGGINVIHRFTCEHFDKIKLILLASITASAVALCASSSMTKARGAIIEFALVSKLPDANFLDYRGVAKVVSRQFRDSITTLGAEFSRRAETP